MLRVLGALPQWSDDYQPIVWTLGVLTLVGGAVMAVVQRNVTRMLAFSSISHAGFILVGVEAAVHFDGARLQGDGVSSVLVYLLVYAVLVMGTFGVVTAVGRTGDSRRVGVDVVTGVVGDDDRVAGPLEQLAIAQIAVAEVEAAH